MNKMTIEEAASRPTWDTLETFARTHVQGFIQQFLEDEGGEGRGRQKAERRGAREAPPGSRNGYGKPRQLALMTGTIAVQPDLTCKVCERAPFAFHLSFRSTRRFR